MKILHINCNYLGTTLHQTMINKLSELDIENQVYVPTFDKNISVIKPNFNVIISECFNKWDRILFDYKQKKIINDIQSKVDISTFNCIHAYTLFTDGNVAMKLSKKYNIPYVVAIRNTDVNDFFRLMIYLRHRGIEIMKNSSAIFFLSKSYQKQVFNKYVPKKYYNELKNKTYIIPNGIDDFWFKNIINININKKQFINCDKKIKLIYAGKIDKNKNILSTQKAMKLLREKGYNISLTIVGKIIDKKEFNKIIKDKNTKYIQEKSKEELIKIYRENDIFIMPSYKETFGLVYAEAMSQGLPVIYTEGQGFDEQFTEGTVGYHVKSDDIEDISKKILKIKNNYNYILKDIVNNISSFDWTKICNEYYSIYKSIFDV